MISILPADVANKIAAGEVVESPVSVVKELVENALDAGATRIDVEVVGGGLKLVKVSDDGCGMSRSDAELSIVRHATSKIKSASDLFALSTMGFRGEALASIAAVSNFKLMTAQETGTKVTVEKGEVLVGSCARMRGTTIEVRDLFSNVPARKKFQKSGPALAAEIYRLVTLMSMAHEEVAFSLSSNGRESFRVPKQSREERARVVMGDAFLDECLPLEFGWVGKPFSSRPNKLSQVLFLNKRKVICDPIAEGVKMAFATRLDPKRYPPFLFFLDVAPEEIDVNVHPQKIQVRLANEEAFVSQIIEEVERALVQKKPPVDFAFSRPEIPARRFQEEVEAKWAEPIFVEEGHPDIIGVYRHYLLLKGEGGLTLFDLNRARQRVRFEELLKEETCVGQGLLVPVQMEANPIEMGMLLTHKHAIESLGFSLCPMQKGHLAIEALPPRIDEGQVKDVLLEMAHKLEGFIGKADIERERRESLALILIRGEKKESYSDEEAVALFKQVKESTDPHHCPKGNPIQTVIEDDKFEDLFRANQEAAKST